MNNSINIRIIYEEKSQDLSIDSNSDIRNLKKEIASKLNLNENNIAFRFGFPPSLVQGNEKDSNTLKEMKITNKEVLRVEFNDNICTSDKVDNTTKSNVNEKTDNVIDETKYTIKRKIIPADNSCLFNAINYAMNQTLSEPTIMRELIAVEIQSNPELYNSAVLDKEPNEYCNWILRDDTWGGGIELAALSKAFQISLGVVDVTNGKIEFVGEVTY